MENINEVIPSFDLPLPRQVKYSILYSQFKKKKGADVKFSNTVLLHLQMKRIDDVPTSAFNITYTQLPKQYLKEISPAH